jgi:putative oxidoreductase
MISRARATELTFFALRVVAGTLFALHGAQKLFGLWGMPPILIGSQVWIGGVIELVAGTLIALGLCARPAAFIASGQMAVAYFQFHWKGGPFDSHAIPFLNNGEPAVLYCFLFLCFAASGAGRMSLDHKRGKA